MRGVSLTHPEMTSFFMWEVSLTHPELTFFFFYVGSFSYTSRAGFFWCEELLSSAVYYENNPLRKDWLEAGPGEKRETVTLKPEKEALEQPEQSRTKPNKT